MKSFENPNDVINHLKLSISLKKFHNDPEDFTVILNQLEALCSGFIDRDFIRTHQKEFHSIISGCINQIFILKDASKSHPYLLVLRLTTKELRHVFRYEYIVKQMLPLICATLWIADNKLMSISVNLIRLSIRYHPKLACEIALKPLLDTVNQTKHEEILRLLFYIHAYNPTCFRNQTCGKFLLSLLKQPNIPLTIQIRTLTLIHRIVDDLPFTGDSTKLCFGPLNECFEALLTSMSAETSALSSSLLIKMAKHNLSEAMLPFANRKLPDRLKIHWPGCLETSLSLLVALSHDCCRRGHGHSEVPIQKQDIMPCVSNSVEAISRYIEEANHIKYVMSCLVALQDLSPITEASTLEPYKDKIAEACHRVGIGTKVSWKDMWMEIAANSSPYLKLETKMDFRGWLDDVSKSAVPQNVTSSRPASMTSTQETEYLSSERSSSSLTTISSSSSGKVSAFPVENYFPRPKQPDRRSHVPGEHRIKNSGTDSKHVNEDTSGNDFSESELTSTSASTNFSRTSNNGDHVMSKSLPRQHESSELTTRAPNVKIIKANPRTGRTQNANNELDRSEVRRAQSARHSQQTAEENGRLMDVQRSRSTYRPADQATSHPNVVGSTSEQLILPTLSSPQLSPLDQQDPIQRFHQRYYDKLLQYMRILQNQFPFPVAVSYQNSEKIGKSQKNSCKDFVWFLNKYDYLPNNRNMDESNDSCGQPGTLNSSDRRELHLHFACSHHHTQCIYPGHNLDSCFHVKTKYPLLWIQLLVLWNQARHGRAIPAHHPAILPLRQLWSTVVNMPVETPPERRIRLGLTTDTVRHSTNRPQSACETANHSTSLASATISRTTPVGKLRLWSSTRSRSKVGLAKVSSFFLLATRAYPNQKECERLVKELQNALLFESFVRIEDPRANPTSRANDQSRSLPNNPNQITAGKSYNWSCVLCKYTSDPPNMRSPSCLREAPLARKESESESLNDISTVLSNAQSPANWIPQMTGVLRSRHLKNVPKALSWLSNWQLNEFVLRDTWFGWHRWRPSAKQPCRNGWTRRERNNRTASRFVTTSEQTSEELKSTENWTAFHASSIRTIQCTRKNRTGALLQLIIDTDNYGKLLLRPSRIPHTKIVPHDHGDNQHTNPYTEGNELTIWLHCLQAAMLRAKQGSYRSKCGTID
ncbi:hypothetical protein D915_007247 [Fasciola hepatica]|uniref:Uncharacterized protein n=1 Tax=Fasciola hepatica TaxID=6192 RepID=A0A4E0R7H5_FASHE|nr:hypothetical protein D915_007247 [Fasciola hepatica]